MRPTAPHGRLTATSNAAVWLAPQLAPHLASRNVLGSGLRHTPEELPSAHWEPARPGPRSSTLASTPPPSLFRQDRIQARWHARRFPRAICCAVAARRGRWQLLRERRRGQGRVGVGGSGSRRSGLGPAMTHPVGPLRPAVASCRGRRRRRRRWRRRGGVAPRVESRAGDPFHQRAGESTLVAADTACQEGSPLP